MENEKGMRLVISVINLAVMCNYNTFRKMILEIEIKILNLTHIADPLIGQGDEIFYCNMAAGHF